MPGFATTHWSQILAARSGPEAARRSLEAICVAYRGPVIAYIVRHGYRPADAEDLAQDFFRQLVERRWDLSADPVYGRFRTLLLTALRRHLGNAAAANATRKRGGDLRRVDHADIDVLASAPERETPEQAFDRAWALALLQRAMDRLRQEAEEAGKRAQFERLVEFIAEPAADRDYQRLGEELGLRSNTLAVAVHRLRHRLRELVRDELLETVSTSHDLECELAHFRSALGGDEH